MVDDPCDDWSPVKPKVFDSFDIRWVNVKVEGFDEGRSEDGLKGGKSDAVDGKRKGG